MEISNYNSFSSIVEALKYIITKIRWRCHLLKKGVHNVRATFIAINTVISSFVSFFSIYPFKYFIDNQQYNLWERLAHTFANYYTVPVILAVIVYNIACYSYFFYRTVAREYPAVISEISTHYEYNHLDIERKTQDWFDNSALAMPITNGMEQMLRSDLYTLSRNFLGRMFGDIQMHLENILGYKLSMTLYLFEEDFSSSINNGENVEKKVYSFFVDKRSYNPVDVKPAEINLSENMKKLIYINPVDIITSNSILLLVRDKFDAHNGQVRDFGFLEVKITTKNIDYKVFEDYVQPVLRNVANFIGYYFEEYRATINYVSEYKADTQIDDAEVDKPEYSDENLSGPRDVMPEDIYPDFLLTIYERFKKGRTKNNEQDSSIDA